MNDPHQLETLLHLLVTDASSVAHLPYILDHLSPASLVPSPHLQRWVVRLTSLMHSKDPAARWAAICIAYRMSFLSKSLLVDNAQSWVGIVFPFLSKFEPIPILRVSMRYLGLVLCAAHHNLEFQRQIAIPMVPKVSSALLAIAEKHNDRDIKTSSIQVLTQLIPLYPSLHKALGQRLFALCNQIFNGSVHTTDTFVDATANLYAILHFIGGKVGGTNLWRNCLDETLQMSWSAWLALRTTFPTSAQMSHNAISRLHAPDGRLSDLISPGDTTTGDPVTIVTSNLSRLKCSISAISALLRAPVTRPVKTPIGHLSAFCWCLLASSLDDEGQTYFDPHVRVVESSIVPEIWNQACRLLSCLVQTAQNLVSPHKSQLITIISSQLENSLEKAQRHSFLRCAYYLLYFCPVVGATLGINRLLKATISIIFPLYIHHPSAETSSETTKQWKTNKRRREYEAGNVFSMANSKICATIDDCDTLLAALDVMGQCMLSTELVPSTRSLANRVLLSILLSLPSIPPSRLSSDASFHGKVIKKARDICIESAQGSTHAMSEGTELVLRSFLIENLATCDQLHSRVDLLLHPRRPPFVRSLPPVEFLSLSSPEESAQEAVTCHSLGPTFGNGEISSNTSKAQHQLESVRQNMSDPEQQVPPSPSREQVLPTPIELRPQATSDATSASNLPVEVATSSTLPMVMSLPFAPDVPTGSLLSPSRKESAPTLPGALMLVDESDQEEVPAIDLGSDSDA